MPIPLAEQVVVITGASSGIGRETALRFAREGATVVLAARNQQALREVEGEITNAGGTALVVPADVADYGHVQRVAHTAATRFGRINTWVNNAAIASYGAFEDISLEEWRRILDVNVMGQVHGARAALPHLRSSRGTLIGIGSVVSEVPEPLLTAYVASKHALKGFYDSLRLEQWHNQTGVRVSFIMPGSVNTPLFNHAATHLGVKPAPIPPVYKPELVAGAILYAAQNPVRDLSVGASAAFFAGLQRLWPSLGDWVQERMGYTTQFSDEPKPASAPNNLFRVMPGPGDVHGDFGAVPFDPVTWLRLRPAVRNVAMGVAAAGLVLPLVGLAFGALALPRLLERERPARLGPSLLGLGVRRRRFGGRLLPASRVFLEGEDIPGS